MVKSKFKRGNLVHIAKDLGISMSHFENDVDVIVMGTYSDFYGGDDIDIYQVMFLDTSNTGAWYKEHQLTLINEGGEHLIKQAQEIRDETVKNNTNIDYIITNLDDCNLTTDAALFLFDLIGYRCNGWYNHGEYYSLLAAWDNLYPLFIHIKNSSSFMDCFADEDDCIKFLPLCIKYNILPDDVERVFNAFHNISKDDNND